ncbi:MAG TPA: hypothetical protein PLJ60_04795 [Chryseolinea sp.]|nr:hypothetical protein [Chryseolinea sp.]
MARTTSRITTFLRRVFCLEIFTEYNLTSTRHYLFTILSLISFTLLGQDRLVDINKKVVEIENYRKYEIVKFDSNDLNHIDKKLIESIDYQGENGLGKTEIKQKIENGNCLATYYFDNQSLIAIKERKYTGVVTFSLMTYYFLDHTFIKAMNDKGADKTSEIDRAELSKRIRNIFAIQIK